MSGNRFIAETTAEVAEGGLDWTIHNFMDLKDTVIRSPSFEVANHTWHFQMKPSTEPGYFAGYLWWEGATGTVDASYSFEFGNARRIESSGVKQFKSGSATERNWGYGKIMPAPAMLAALQNGALKVKINVRVIAGEVRSKIVASLLDRAVGKWSSRLADDFARLYSEMARPDITFNLADGKRARAHKLILSARSAVFRTMFENGMRESTQSEISLPAVDEKPFNELLSFMYSGRCNAQFLHENKMEMLGLADQYDLQDLRETCENLLMQDVTVETAVSMLLLADRHHCQSLKRQTLNFIAVNLVDVFRTDEFRLLILEAPQLVAEIQQMSGNASSVGSQSAGGDQTDDSPGGGGKSQQPCKRRRFSPQTPPLPPATAPLPATAPVFGDRTIVTNVADDQY